MNLTWISSALASSARSPDELRAVSHFGPNEPEPNAASAEGQPPAVRVKFLQPFSTFCTNEANRQKHNGNNDST